MTLGVRAIVWGLVIVIVDIEWDRFDVLPDVAGWLLVLFAAAANVHSHASLRWAAGAASVGLVAAGLGAFGPDQVSRTVLAVVATGCETVVVFTVLTAVAALVPVSRGKADVLRYAVVAAAVLVAVLAYWGEEQAWKGFVLLILALPTLGLYVFALFLTYRTAPQMAPVRTLERR